MQSSETSQPLPFEPVKVTYDGCACCVSGLSVGTREYRQCAALPLEDAAPSPPFFSERNLQARMEHLVAFLRTARTCGISPRTKAAAYHPVITRS